MAALIARAALFGNPLRTQARLSPDGRYISFLAPRDGVLNVWLAPFCDLAAARPITADQTRGIREHYWAPTGRHVLYLQDEGGDENWRVLSVAVESGAEIDLTPLPGVQAQLVGLSAERPDVALIGLNNRKPEWHDLYEVDIASGARKLVEENDLEFAAYLEDLQLVPQLALKTLPDGGGELFRRASGGWESFLRYAQADSLTTRPLIVEAGGTALLLSALGRDKAALMRVDLANGKQSLVGESERADISDAWLHPRTRELQAYAVDYLTSEITPVTSAAARDIEILRDALGPQFTVTSRTLDDCLWVVVVDDPARAPASHLYARASGRVTKLFDQRPELADAPLQPMRALEIRARDGLTLVSYLTLPPGVSGQLPREPLPLVLDVHGGPWARDSYGFNAEHQWLANRGYAVLAVNYRGSMGFGKSFINAGDGEWAAKMHEDLLDAVAWAVREKIADARKVAIYGASYGGYAALVGLTFTPAVFACGVDLVGPSNLVTLLESIPPYWKAFFEDMARRVGDPRTPGGRALLNARSPLTHVERIRRPLLIVQGANDPRVKQAEADQIVAAMQAKHLPVTYALYHDEGHGFARPQNRLSFYALTEAFLSQYLGGRCESVGRDFEDSSVNVAAGGEFLPDMAAALVARRAGGAG
jgi:dipeptidyl aminopeptidase/acylaminoacyl peptidase